MSRPKDITRYFLVPPRVTDPRMAEWMRDVARAIENLQNMISLGDSDFKFDGNVVGEVGRFNQLIVENANGRVFIDPKRSIELSGSATVFDDQQVSVGSVTNAADDPDIVSYKSSQVLAFGSEAPDEGVTFDIQLTHKYKGNTILKPHIHVVYPNANAGESVWTLTYTWANVNEVFPTETSDQQIFAAPRVADKHVIHSFDDIQVSGDSKSLSSFLLLSLTRNGSEGEDTYGSDIYLLGFDIHLELNRIGSNEEYHN